MALGVAAMLGNSSAMAADPHLCVTRSEVPALETRLLQTELMVAALTCKQRAGYNSIIAKFSDELVDGGRVLKRLFKRLHGVNSEKRLNRFITRLANEASVRSLHKVEYCESASKLMHQTLALKVGALTDFAGSKKFTKRHGLALCDTASQISQSN